MREGDISIVANHHAEGALENGETANEKESAQKGEGRRVAGPGGRSRGRGKGSYRFHSSAWDTATTCSMVVRPARAFSRPSRRKVAMPRCRMAYILISSLDLRSRIILWMFSSGSSSSKRARRPR